MTKRTNVYHKGDQVSMMIYKVLYDFYIKIRSPT